MKKILAGLFVAILLAAGLVAFSGGAQAAPDCPYTGCVDTNTHVDAPNKVRRGDSARICVHVGTNGNGQPKGSVDVTVTRDGDGFSWSDGRKYNDWNECFSTPDLNKRGDYTVKAHFEAKDGSAYRNSNDSTDFRVVRR